MGNGIRVIAVALAFSAPVVMAGCGGSGDDAPATTGSAGFVATANAICAEANTKFEALGNTQEFSSLADFRERFGKAIAIARAQYDDIAALEPPADIAADVATYLEKGTAGLARTEDLYQRVMGGEDLADAEAATIGSTAGQQIVTDRRQAALASGLDACAS